MARSADVCAAWWRRAPCICPPHLLVNAVHPPPPRYIFELDAAVGSIMAAVNASDGSSSDTVVVFVSDNGAPLLLNAPDRNYPLRGFKTVGA